MSRYWTREDVRIVGQSTGILYTRLCNLPHWQHQLIAKQMGMTCEALDVLLSKAHRACDLAADIIDDVDDGRMGVLPRMIPKTAPLYKLRAFPENQSDD